MIVLLACAELALGVASAAGLILLGFVAPGLALLLVSVLIALGALDFVRAT